jgi:hypothetical protein
VRWLRHRPVLCLGLSKSLETMALPSESNNAIASEVVSVHGQPQLAPTGQTTTEFVTARGTNPAAHAPNSEPDLLLSPALFVQALDDEPEPSSLEEKDGNEDKESIQSEQPRGHVADGVAAAGHRVAHGSTSLPWDYTMPDPEANEGDDPPVPASVPSSRTAFAFPSQEIPFPLPTPTPPVTSAEDGDPIWEATANAAAASSEEHQHQAFATSLPPTVPLPVPACDLGLPASVTSSSSPLPSPLSSSSPAPQPMPVSSSKSSSKDATNTGGNNKGGQGRNISSVARRFLEIRKSGFFKWPSLKEEDPHASASAPVPPLPPSVTTVMGTGAASGLGSSSAPPVLPPIQPTRTLTAPSHLSSLASLSLTSPLHPSPRLTIAQSTLSAVKVSQNRTPETGANTEIEGTTSKGLPIPRSPLPPPPPSPNMALGQRENKVPKPRKRGKWHLAEDSNGDDGDTSSVTSDSERDNRELEDAPRGRALLRDGNAQARTTEVSASHVVMTRSTCASVGPSLKAKLPSPSPSPVAVAFPPKVDEIVSNPAPAPDQIRDRSQPPTLKLEVSSLSDVNLAFFGAEANAGKEVGDEYVNVVIASSPAETMATLWPVATTSPVATSATLADSDEGQEEGKDAKDDEDEHEDEDGEARDSFDADAQFLTPEPTPTSSTNGTLSPTFVFPPPGVPRSPSLAIPLPPSPVSPVSPHSHASAPPQPSPSPLSKRKTIFGAIRLVRSVKKGVSSSKKNNATNDVEGSRPKSALVHSKMTRDGDREGTKQPKSRPPPISIKRAPDPRRSVTLPPPHSSTAYGGSGEGRHLVVPLSRGTQTRVQIVQKERQPLRPTMHTGGTIQAQTWEIMDEESRRLSEVAFM